MDAETLARWKVSNVPGDEHGLSRGGDFEEWLVRRVGEPFWQRSCRDRDSVSLEGVENRFDVRPGKAELRAPQNLRQFRENPGVVSRCELARKGQTEDLSGWAGGRKEARDDDVRVENDEAGAIRHGAIRRCGAGGASLPRSG